MRFCRTRVRYGIDGRHRLGPSREQVVRADEFVEMNAFERVEHVVFQRAQRNIVARTAQLQN